jgi:hypothetical protein
MTRAAAVLTLAVLLSFSGEGRVYADERPRPVPDYDGRPDEPPNVGEVLIWIPRTLLYPGYLVTEYVVRRPVGAFVTWLERQKVVQQAYGLLTFGSGGNFGVFPTALFDFGLRPSVGLYAFVDPLLHRDNRFRVSAAYGGPDWLSVGAKERFILASDDGGEIILRGGYSRRPDYPFYGIGPDAFNTDETFYRLSRWEAALSIGLRSEHFGFTSEMRYLWEKRDVSNFGLPSQDFFGPGSAEPTYFLDAGVTDWDKGMLLEQRFALYADTRGRGATFQGSGTGARLDLRGGLGWDPDDVATQRWYRYGGEASLFLDLDGTRRVFGLNTSVDAVHSLGDDPLPATALVGLGGLETMRAFYEGRFLGQSGATATLEYRWPVASFIDAELFASVGNVFGESFEDFDLDKLAGSGGFALRTNTSRDLSFDILIAAGTRQFDHPWGFAVDSIRFALGTNRGF